MQTLIPPLDDSALALGLVEVGSGESVTLHDAERDSLLYVSRGSGSLTLDGTTSELARASGALVLAGEEATIAGDELEVVRVTVGPATDRHAPLGPREIVVRVDPERVQQALESRGYQILFGPHNGSTRATLFVGFVPPGRSPWHFHLYDEIVFIPQGPGRVHRAGVENTEPLTAGSAFRLRPREVHVVENASADEEMTVVGFFTPAGSPSAAYLAEPGAPGEPRGFR
jgi:quercetin dioxygenase-like cupin family protein